MANSYYSIIEPILLTASRLEAIASRCLFRPIGMNISSVKIMSLLCRRKSMTPKEIMKLVGGTKSNISQRIDSLEKRGYVRTHKHIFNDGRKLSVELTIIGKEKLHEIKNHFRKVKLELESHFSQEEIKQHFEFFNKLNTIVDLEEKKFFKCKHFCKPK